MERLLREMSAPLPASRGTIHRERLLALACVLGLLPLALPALSAQAEPTTIATLTVVTGRAEIVRGGGPPVAADVDARLRPGDEIRTSADGKVEVQYDSGHILRLAENTRIRLSDDEKRPGLFVFVGKLWARFKTMLGQSKFEVQTPTVVAGIRGTTVTTEVEEDGTSEIGVEEGEVELTGPELVRPMVIKARQRARLARGQRRLAPLPFRADQFPRWCYWTDTVAAQRVKKLAESARQNGAQIKQALDEAEKLDNALNEDVKAAHELLRALSAHKDEVSGTVVRRPRRGAKTLPKPRPTAAKLDEWDRLLEQLQAKLLAQQKALTQRSQQAAALRRRVGALLGAQKAIVTQLDRFHRRRHFDPHWAQLRPAYEQTSATCQEMTKSTDRVVALLDATAVQTGTQLFGCQRRAQHCAALLQQVTDQLTAQRRFVQALRRGEPLPQMKPKGTRARPRQPRPRRR